MNVNNSSTNKKDLLRIYKNALESRYLDERLQETYYARKAGKSGERINIILSGVGAELGPSVISTQLRKEDTLIPRYRGFASLLGKGISPDRIAAELLRKKTGMTKGIGDIMGYRGPEHGIPGSSANLGAMFAFTIGLAFAKVIKNEPGIIVQFFGDGEASRSTFGSALNLAALWKLPILFVCENNRVCISMDHVCMSSTRTIAQRADGYGIPNMTADEMKPMLLYRSAKEALEHVRTRRLPMLFEIFQTRFMSHSTDFDSGPFLGKNIPSGQDPLEQFKHEISEQGIAASELKKTKEEAEQEITRAFKHAENDNPISDEEFFSIYRE